MRILYYAPMIFLLACGDKVTEGMTPGDCSDGADNDGDGLFDCNDDGCQGAPDCVSDDTGELEDPGNPSDTDDPGVSDPLDVDDDGDGFTENQGDCDDTDSTINPDAQDTWYDGVDQNCDGLSDYDQDGDGEDSDQYGGTDCNDADPEFSAAALDQTTDGVDQNCDGIDGVDQDGDGFADSTYGGDDCDDTLAFVNPGAEEIFDNNIDDDCDGIADVQGASCTADFTFTLPNGDTASMDGCVDWTLSPIFNFDPQDTPWLRHFTMVFNGTNTAGFDCRVTIEQNNLCEDGFYDIQSQSTSVVFVTTDCLDIPIEYESTYSGTEGYLRIDNIDTGNQGGSFINLPLLTSIDGHLSAQSTSGVGVQGDFSIALTQIAQFEEDTSTCDEVDVGLVDGDGDGVNSTYFGGDDCDDANANIMSMADDMDCDGVLTADDCDDNDITLLAIADDMDCDGVLTADDCDDSDSSSTVVATDGDCDGVLTADDCDDGDPLSTVVATDADCDGVLTADDCNDNDANTINDMDCDGVLTADDCDDNDPGVLAISGDADCDGVLTADDCDDSDPVSTVVAEDGDCDGVLTADDCDDGDLLSTVVATDGDCDGALTADDCDDGDPLSTVIAEDVDCDGVITTDDCDDNDPNTIYDMDCDGVLTVDDCDDNDPMSTVVAEDLDCDGVLTVDDCDDSDAAVNVIVHRMTKSDGTGNVLSTIEELETNQGVPVSDIDTKLNGDSNYLSNHTTTTNYDENGDVESELVEFPNYPDASYEIEYDASGRVSYIENSLFSSLPSLQQEYTYDSNGEWVEHLLSGMFTEQISRTVNGNIVEYASSYNNHVFEYNGNTLIGYEKTDQSGDQLIREWDVNGDLTFFENSIGLWSTIQEAFTYSNGQLVMRTDNRSWSGNAEVMYTYDAQGRLAEKVYVDPYMTQFAASSGSCLNQWYSYLCVNNVFGDPHAKFTYTYTNGALSEVVYDTTATDVIGPDVLYKDITPYDYIEQYTYHSSGELESVTRYIDKHGDGISNQVYQVEYDLDGNVTAQGFVWNPGTYGYDSQGNYYFYYEAVDLSNGWPYSNIYAQRSEFTYQYSWNTYGVSQSPYYTSPFYNVETIQEGSYVYDTRYTTSDRFQYPAWTQDFDVLQSNYGKILDTYNFQAVSRFTYDGNRITKVETDRFYDNPASMDVVSDLIYDVDGNIIQVLVDINGDAVIDYAQNMQYDSFGELIYFDEDYENDGEPDTYYAVQITRDVMNNITEKAFDYDLDGTPEHSDVYNNQYNNGELVQVEVDFYNDSTVDEVRTYETVCE